MKIYYFKAKEGNFGDDLNEWLWQRLLPNVFDDDERIRMSGIGTILGRDMPKAEKWIIFGSGTGYSSIKGKGIQASWEVVAVRGPLTAAVLNLPKNAAVSDGALLLNMLPECIPVPENKRKNIVFMPHHGALNHGPWEEACKEAGIEFIDPRNESKDTIQKLRHAKLVLADAMHAAIVADTLRVPWIPLSTSNSINSFKWSDWTLSLNLPYLPKNIPALTLSQKISDSILSFRGGYRTQAQTAEEIEAYYRSRLEGNFSRKFDNLGRILADYVGKGFSSFDHVEKNRSVIISLLAEALSKSTSYQPYLSDDTIFKERTGQLAERLEKIPNLLNKVRNT